MAGVLPTEGRVVIGNMVFKQDNTNRGTGLELGLFTYSGAVDATITYATLSANEASGGGYARIALADGSWANSAGVMTFAKQTFTATGTSYATPIKGYFICTTGASRKLLAVEVDGAGPFPMALNDTYDVTPTINILSV